MTTAEQTLGATNVLASQGIVASSVQLAALCQGFEDLGALIEALSAAIAADTPVDSAVQAALDVVVAKVAAIAAPVLSDIAPVGPM